jgi:hypothetical protein
LKRGWICCPVVATDFQSVDPLLFTDVKPVEMAAKKADN